MGVSNVATLWQGLFQICVSEAKTASGKLGKIMLRLFACFIYSIWYYSRIRCCLLDCSNWNKTNLMTNFKNLFLFGKSHRIEYII